MVKNSQKQDCCNSLSDLFSLSPIAHKPIDVSFTSSDLSSQGGLLLLREYTQGQALLSSICDQIEDTRCEYLVRHHYIEMLTQRVFQIASGYEDADDCDLLRQDSILKMCVGRLPDGPALSSQPTMTRLENKVTAKELYGIGEVFIDDFIASYTAEPKVIILDCDDTNFDTHGAQQGTLFNHYYDEYCYMPLLIFEGISGKMILPMLREGRRNKSTNISGILKRVIERMHKVWKKTRFIVRGDSHFCSHQFMDWARDKDYVEFITGLAGNKVLSKRVQPWVEMAEKRYEAEKAPIRFYKKFRYRAGTWKHAQRIIVKIEVGEMGTNIRYIVTSLQHNNARFLYEDLYCGRGQMELYIKELKTYLDADRTSCNSFRANQFRLFMHAAAYVLLLGMKNDFLADTSLANASILTIREKILCTAVQIRCMKSKVKVEFPRNHPLVEDMGKVFRRCSWRKVA